MEEAEVQKYLDAVFGTLSQNVEVKGFRKGMAPKALAIEAIGQSRLLEEALNLILNETYPNVLKENKLYPLQPPQISILEYPSSQTLIEVPGKTNSPSGRLVYQAEVDVMPEVEMGEYKNKIQISKSKTQKEEVKKEEIEAVLSHLQRQNAKFLDIDREAREEDRVEIDFQGSVNGVPQESLTSKNHPVILGQKTLLPEFEEKIIGTKKGEEKKFTLELAKPGSQDKPLDKVQDKQKVDFQVKVLDVKEVILPKLDLEFAKKLGEKDLDAVRDKIKKNLSDQKEQRLRHQFESNVIKETLTIFKAELPQSLIQAEFQRIKSNFTQSLLTSGLTLPKYLEQISKTETEIDQEFQKQAQEAVKIGLMLGEVIKREGIDPKDKSAAKKAVEKLVSYAVK